MLSKIEKSVIVDQFLYFNEDPEATLPREAVEKWLKDFDSSWRLAVDFSTAEFVAIAMVAHYEGSIALVARSGGLDE